MAWEEDAPEILRVMVDDMDSPQTFTDDKLLRVLTVAAWQVTQELVFVQSYAISILNQTVLPDPTVAARRRHHGPVPTLCLG